MLNGLETVAQARSSGDVTKVESEPEEDEEANSPRRSRDIQVWIGRRWRLEAQAHRRDDRWEGLCGLYFAKQLAPAPRGKMAVVEDDAEKPGDTTTIIMCDPQMTGRTFSCLGSRGRCWMMEVSCTDSPR